MERQYVAVDLHAQRSLIVREDEAGDEVGVMQIDNDPLSVGGGVGGGGTEPGGGDRGDLWLVLGGRCAPGARRDGAAGEPVRARGVVEERRVKNDYLDCRELIDRMRLHKLPEAWIAPPELRELRELVRYRAKLVCIRTGLKAQVKAVLAKHACIRR